MARKGRQALNCMVLSGHAVSDSICSDMWLACCAMARSNTKTFDLKTDEMEGRIETEWAEAGVGGIWGYTFSAHIEMDRGTTYMRYIIAFHDLERIEDLDLEQLADPRWSNWIAPTRPGGSNSLPN